MKNFQYETYCDECDKLLVKFDEKLNIDIYEPYYSLDGKIILTKPKDESHKSNYQHLNLEGHFQFCSEECLLKNLRKQVAVE